MSHPSFSNPTSPPPLTRRNPQHKIAHNSGQQGNSQEGRTQAIIKPALAAHADAPGAPVERDEGVDHGGHGDEGEQSRRDATGAVMPEVEQAHREPAEDDGEVQVREEGALVGEEYFRLHSRRKRNAFSRGALEEGLRGHFFDWEGPGAGRGCLSVFAI